MTHLNVAKRYFRLFSAIAMFVLPLIFILPAHGQMDQGTITGVVTDKSGAVIANARLTLVSIDTGLTLKTKSDGAGFYSFPAIKVGNYRVTASATGFKTTTQDNLHLDIQARLKVVLVLQPGSVSESIVVESAPPLLQTEDASVGQVMSTQTINNTPLNGRNWIYIAQLAAGVDPSNGARGNGNGDFNANGQRAEQNNFILDGVDNNYGGPGYLSSSSYAVQPPPDALSEFNLQTADYSAEFGHSAGSVINASIKSGTNNIHGDLWEYFRNDVLDARDFDALTIPKYRENQFGATLGTPLLRNKLFFFGYAEANRIVFGETDVLSVPTARMRQGDFTELLNPSLTSSGHSVTLYQPGSAGTIPLACNGQQNVICPNQVNPIAQRIFSLYPMPNTNGGKLYSNYNNNRNVTSNSWQWGIRVDWNLLPQDQFFVRFSYVNAPSTYLPPLGTILDGGAFGTDGTNITISQNLALSETHIFNSTLTNEFRIGYNYGNYARLQFNSNSDVASALGMGGVPSGFDLGGLPAVSLDELSGFGTPGYLPNRNFVNTSQVLDNLVKTLGNHMLKFGINFQNLKTISVAPPAALGSYTYNGTFTAIPGKSYTGFGAADFLLDQMASASLSNTNRYHNSRWYRAAYVEDTWKVTPKLTLNSGLRYEFFQPNKEIDGRQANFIIQGPVSPGYGTGILLYPTAQQNAYLAPAYLKYLSQNNVTIQYSTNLALANAQLTNFAPRFGFAYNMIPNWVVRGGFGLFYGGMESNGGDSFMKTYPFQFTSNFPRPSSCTPGKCATNGLSLESGFDQALAQGLTNYVSQPAFYGIQRDVQTPYVESYNLSLEHALSNNLVAGIRYVGSIDRHLQSNANMNNPAALTDPRLNSNLARPFPTLGGIVINAYQGISTYNGLQTRVERRFTNGLSFLATYTWAHSLGDAQPPLGTNGVSGYRGSNLIGIRDDYTNSSWDVRHRLTFNGFYELPFGAGKHFMNRRGWTNSLLGGWSTDLQFSAQTGFPFTVNTNLGSAGPNGGTAHAIKVRNIFSPGGSPDPSNPGITCATKTRTLQHWYNPCAFANPPVAFPNASIAGSPVSQNKIVGQAALPYLGGRALSVPGPGYERINMSIFKNFSTFQEQSLQFRVDVFNVFNTPAYDAPSTANNSTNGGLITSSRFFQNLTPDARFLQISAKYVF